MPTEEDILRGQTFKDDVDDLEKRIYYTLTAEEKLQNHRTAKAVAFLVKTLHEKQILNEEQIDKLLLQCVT